MIDPGQSSTARLTVFSSSRTFPAHLRRMRHCRASSENSRWSRPCSRLYFSRKCWANSGTSETICARLGMVTVITLRR